MYRQIYNRIKPIIPKISQTEMIALRCGGVSIDKDIFSGKFNKQFLNNKINNFEHKYINETDLIINKISKIKKTKNYDFSFHKKVMEILGNHKFLGFIIDNKYKGNKISTFTQGKILTRIASFDPSMAINTMVPNSLGPGELISHYGTIEQKNKYLEGLTCGKYIPCFGLTGPNNGSDATGNLDKGYINVDENGNKYIMTTINKRYITLAPIANLIGIAINVIDDKKILKKDGITVILLERGFPGLKQDTYHQPMGVDFPNGTLKGTLKIPLENVIGGEKMIGEGWKMLMECLSSGRAVSLPCSANGANQSLTFGTYHYVNHRNQFKIPIKKMEGVKEKFVDMFLNTWIVNSNIDFTNNILDDNVKPSVISAIMKQQCTERSRNVINHSMDILAGSAIILGENNFCFKYYLSSPISITVEGSNTLTRSLMIFGQGLNNAHPHIFNLFNNFNENNIEGFKNNFNKMMSHVIINFLKSSLSINNSNEINNLENNIIRFANLSNFVALLGGKIKSNQMLSGDMADILSSIYLAHGVIWFNNINNNKYNDITNNCLNLLNIETENKINKVIDNYPNYLKYLLKLSKTKTRNMNYNSINKIYENIENENLINVFENNIYIQKNSILDKLNKLSKLDNDSQEYKNLYNDIISVSEVKIN